jgi:hypothetical protein
MDSNGARDDSGAITVYFEPPGAPSLMAFVKVPERFIVRFVSQITSLRPTLVITRPQCVVKFSSLVMVRFCEIAEGVPRGRGRSHSASSRRRRPVSGNPAFRFGGRRRRGVASFVSAISKSFLNGFRDSQPQCAFKYSLGNFSAIDPPSHLQADSGRLTRHSEKGRI